MSRPDPIACLQQMLSHAEEIVELTAGCNREALESRVLNLAVSRLLEIVGEAANRMPATERRRHPEIPWRQIIDLRNRLIHAYDDVDLDIVWSIVEHSLPAVITDLKKALASESPE